MPETQIGAAPSVDFEQAIPPFILGIPYQIEDSAFRSTEQLNDLVGHNTGNLAFHHAIATQLGIRTSLPWHAEPGRIDGAGSLAVIPCANQLGMHVDYGSLAERFEKIRVPAVAIGLGAQGGIGTELPDVPEGSIRWLRSIIARSPSGRPNVSVRGPFTLKVLEKYGLGDHAVVLGCPSLFINPDPQLGKKIAERIRYPKRVAVAAGHFKWKHLARLEASLAHIAESSGGSYIAQSPLEMLKLCRGEAAALPQDVLKECRDFARPDLDLPDFVRWADERGQIFLSIQSWMEHLRKFDFVVGLRIHGVVLALMAGIPGLCIAHDSRTLELCEVMRVPYVLARDVVNGMSRDELLKRFDFDPDQFDQNRREIGSRYSTFLSGNGLNVNPAWKALIKPPAASA